MIARRPHPRTIARLRREALDASREHFRALLGYFAMNGSFQVVRGDVEATAKVNCDRLNAEWHRAMLAMLNAEMRANVADARARSEARRRKRRARHA